MAKVKIARKSISLDMTAMCDVAFLLLTFFMLTTQFRPDEPVQVVTPSSVAETLLPDADLMTITIGSGGGVFFGITGQHDRVTVLDNMSQKYNIPFTDRQKHEFSLISAFGVPMNQLPAFLDLPRDKRNALKTDGIPADSTNNELRDWIAYSRYANRNLRIAIKGDRESNYSAADKVIRTLQDQNINKFNLITNLEGRPKGLRIED